MAFNTALNYRPSDWYWFIGGDTSNVWSSARAMLVPATDADYVAWLAARLSAVKRGDHGRSRGDAGDRVSSAERRAPMPPTSVIARRAAA